MAFSYIRFHDDYIHYYSFYVMKRRW